MNNIREKILLGCHVSMKKPDYLLGSLSQALEYNANCYMIYLGAPQTSNLVEFNLLNIDDFTKKALANNINITNVVVHAPYIVNMASSEQLKHDFSISFLKKEISLMNKIGLKFLVVHPGSNINTQAGVSQIAKVINQINKTNDSVIICLETMAGKGNEIGRNFDQLKLIFDQIEKKANIGFCFDTCHMNDQGYDVSKINDLLEEFDQLIGLDFLKVIHINDSNNNIGEHKDRHANIGKGTIGYITLKNWVWNDRLTDKIKILETPYENNRPIYKEEIGLLLK